MFKKHEKIFLGELFESLTEKQMLEVFMSIIDPEQETELFTMMPTELVRVVWSMLNKARRMRLFAAFSNKLKVEFMITPDYLDSDLKHRLWDNIELKGRLQVWNLLKTREIRDLTRPFAEVASTEDELRELQLSLIEELTIMQTVRLWRNLPKDEQVNYINMIATR